MGRREWTEDEEEYLLSRYVHQPIKTTAKRLNRSEYSVKQKAARLGLNKYSDELCVKQIAKAFNVDYSVPLRWAEKFDMPLSYVKDYGHMTRRFVEGDKFWKWAKTHAELIPWSQYEPYSILPQPSWVSKCIQKYKYSRARKRFTKHEKALIVHMRQQGKSFHEISERFERTEESVKHVWRNNR